MRKKIISLLFFIFSVFCKAQVPVFGNDIPVSINGYTLDAMEPFISPDGNAIFFNSLNDGNTTSLYYAAKVNDSTFNLVGLVPVVNQSVTPRLDAVASVDTSNNFFWVSTRNYPADMDNLFRIRFLSAGYTNFGRVHGNIYIYNPGWLIMDAAINYDGDKLLYCNAFFNSCNFNLPCKSVLNYAQKTNDSTFTKLPNSAFIFANVNDTANYIVYAPHLSKDELSLYYTRALKNVPQTEICVSVRTITTQAFGLPSILVPASSSVPEAPTLTSDQLKLYYHKNQGGKFKLFLRYRTGTTSIAEQSTTTIISIIPSISNGVYTITGKFDSYDIFDIDGQMILNGNTPVINLKHHSPGLYIIAVKHNKICTPKRVILVED
jgi:hypothetical protein